MCSTSGRDSCIGSRVCQHLHKPQRRPLHSRPLQGRVQAEWHRQPAARQHRRWQCRAADSQTSVSEEQQLAQDYGALGEKMEVRARSRLINSKVAACFSVQETPGRDFSMGRLHNRKQLPGHIMQDIQQARLAAQQPRVPHCVLQELGSDVVSWLQGSEGCRQLCSCPARPAQRNLQLLRGVSCSPHGSQEGHVVCFAGSDQ